MIPSVRPIASEGSRPFGLLSLTSRRLQAIVCLTVLILSGCQTAGRESRWHWPSFGLSEEDDRSQRDISGIAGPLQRMVQNRQEQQLPKNERDRIDRERLDEARKLFDNKEYAQAARSFEDIQKRRTQKKFGFLTFNKSKDKPYLDPIREEALFYRAESEYQQSHLPKAAEVYQALVKDYPSSRYLDQTTRRLFDISKRWLELEDFATSGEIRQVSLDDPAERGVPLSEKTIPKKRFGWMPNFRDPTRPTLDTSGRAIEALKSIWLNDPSGPLADDSLMLAATFHLRNRNYQEADRLLTILREEFPKSPHLQTAFVIGSHVKLMSYQGAAYDAEQLEEAKKLKESTLRLFPDAPETDRIRMELKAIHEARARRLWETAIFYERKKKPRAVGVYLRELLKDFPDCSLAPEARQKLAELGEAGLPQSPPDASGSSSEGVFKSLIKERPLMPFRSEPAEKENPKTSEDENGQAFPSGNKTDDSSSNPQFDDDTRESPTTPPRTLNPESGRPAKPSQPSPLAENMPGRVRL